jgi:hypothetical protein
MSDRHKSHVKVVKLPAALAEAVLYDPSPENDAQLAALLAQGESVVLVTDESDVNEPRSNGLHAGSRGSEAQNDFLDVPVRRRRHPL